MTCVASHYTEEALRSRTNSSITSGQVYSWTFESLLQARLVKDHGWKCTAAVVLSMVLRAATRMISVSAACRDIAHGPSDQAVMTALEDGLPKTLLVLERRLNDTLAGPLPRRMRPRAWEIAIDYRRHRNRKDGKQRRQKLLFAAWRVHGSPTEIRHRYRRRFGIETSYRQMRQARIYTCTRSPRLRLFFLALGLILRNIWVWIHQTRLAEGSGTNLLLHLELLRFQRMLDWLDREIIALFHDGSTPCTVRPP
jgi:hypothetical protein